MNAGLASALKSSIFFNGSVIVSQLRSWTNIFVCWNISNWDFQYYGMRTTDEFILPLSQAWLLLEERSLIYTLSDLLFSHPYTLISTLFLYFIRMWNSDWLSNWHILIKLDKFFSLMYIILNSMLLNLFLYS